MAAELEAKNSVSSTSSFLDRQGPPLALIGLCILCLLPGLFMGLYADDWFQVRERSLAEVVATFTGDWNAGARASGGFYRPLVRSTFHLDNMLYGLSAWGYHLTNGLLFSLILWAVYATGAFLYPAMRWHVIAIIAAILVLNPIKTEALYWVSGRTDLLAAGLVLWSWYWALRALHEGVLRRALYSLVFLVLGLLSKEVAIAGCLILPVTALLLGRPGAPNRALLILGPVLLGCIYMVLRSSFLGGLAGYSEAGEPQTMWSLLSNIGIMLSGIWWPWQAQGPAQFNLVFALPGLFVAFALAARVSFPRPAVAAAAAMAIALGPMMFITVSPVDGTRVLVLGLGFQAILLMILLLGIPYPRILRIPMIGVGGILALSLIPDQYNLAGQYIRAEKPNRESVEAMWSYVQAAPDGAVIVLPEAPREFERRILNPGEAPMMAMLTHWAARKGAGWKDASDLRVPRVALRLEEESRSLQIASVLQPWMEDPLLRLEHPKDSPIGGHWLRRVAVEDGGTTDTLSLPAAVYTVEIIADHNAPAPRVEAVQGDGAIWRGVGSFAIPRSDGTIWWIESPFLPDPGPYEVRWDLPSITDSLRLQSVRVGVYVKAEGS